MNNKCLVCEKNVAIHKGKSMIISIDIDLCDRCFKVEAEPYLAIVFCISMIDDLEVNDFNNSLRESINHQLLDSIYETLMIVGKTFDDLKNDVVKMSSELAEDRFILEQLKKIEESETTGEGSDFS